MLLQAVSDGGGERRAGGQSSEERVLLACGGKELRKWRWDGGGDRESRVTLAPRESRRQVM